MITVLFFAVARERAGCSSTEVSWRSGLDLQTLAGELCGTYPELTEVLPFVRYAVNERFEYDACYVLEDGDVVALIPPVSGGNGRVRLTETPLDPREVEALVRDDRFGALVTFSGMVRNHTGAHGVLCLDYEAYGSMALRVFGELIEEISGAFPEVRLAVHHRIGHLEIGDVAVVIAAASPHRADAFAAAQRLIERLKEDVPIFKRESRSDGSVWVGMGS